MEEAVFVHVRQPSQDLIDHRFYFCFRKTTALLLHLGVHLVQIVLQVLEDHVQFIRNQQHFLKFDDVGAVEFAEGLDVPQFDTLIPTVVLLFHLFDGDDFASLGVGGLVDAAESPVAEGLEGLVFLHIRKNKCIQRVRLILLITFIIYNHLQTDSPLSLYSSKRGTIRLPDRSLSIFTFDACCF